MNENLTDWIGRTQSVSDIIRAGQADLMSATMARADAHEIGRAHV